MLIHMKILDFNSMKLYTLQVTYAQQSQVHIPNGYVLWQKT